MSRTHGRGHSGHGHVHGHGSAGKPPPSLGDPGTAQSYPLPPPPPDDIEIDEEHHQDNAGDGFADEDFLAVIDEMTAEELRESCDELGFALPASAAVQEMRAKLRQHYVPNASPLPVVTAQPGASGRGRSTSRGGESQNWLV